MSKWYMTVGYPGGEFVSRDLESLRHLYPDLNKGNGDLLSRECPPDLAEWLGADVKTPVWQENFTWQKFKVTGGWLLIYAYDAPMFIPVAGAAGITVLESGE